MSNPKSSLLLRAVVCAQIASLVFPASMQAGDWPVLKKPRKASKVETLAKKLDDVQKHVDSYGSVVAKSPDVWGESRLMRNRAEVEQQLKARLSSFRFRINARQSTRDAALLAQAVALQEQVANGQTAVGDPDSQTSGMVSDFEDTKVVPRTDFTARTNTSEPAIEPDVELDQLNRYLQHLNELRRLNEGDDTADSPGYALNLIRIPVSVLPGSRTRTGYGAEVEITIDPHFGDELLPMAFRDLVINGVRNRITYDAFAFATQAKMQDVRGLISDYYSGRLYYEFADVLDAAREAGISRDYNAAELAFDSFVRSAESIRIGQDPNPRATQKTALVEAEAAIQLYSNAPLDQFGQRSDAQRRHVLNKLDELGNPTISTGLSRFAALSGTNFSSLPPSFADSVNGHTLIILADYLHSRLVVPPRTNQETIDEQDLYLNGLTYPAAEELLSEELRAAYEFLSRDRALHLWDEFCTPELAAFIRENRGEVPSEQSDYLNDRYLDTMEDREAGVETATPVEWDPELGI